MLAAIFGHIQIASIPCLDNDQGGQIYTVNDALFCLPCSAYSESLTNDRESTNVSMLFEYQGEALFHEFLLYSRQC